MSSNTVLKACGVSKRFEMYAKPHHRLKQMLAGRWKTYYHEFWALRDVSFEISRGECVGIIGRNGAGKSTLLQILVGTLQPTCGTVEVNGRIAALLELGSGFNPEFTGRENVYMNAAILGLSRRETEERYDEIVSFADIGEFIEQPVKTYSSGMLVRLAFAVQVAVEPDILIVDEALAVGDAAFQRKCFARLERLVKSGTTLLLVTHDTETVKRMCSRAIFLKDGACAFDGKAADGVLEFMHYLFPEEKPAPEPPRKEMPAPSPCASGTLTVDVSEQTSRYGIGGGKIVRIELKGIEEPNLLRTPCRLKATMHARLDPDFLAAKLAEGQLEPNLNVGCGLMNAKNIMAYATNLLLENVKVNPLGRKNISFGFEIDLPQLAPGDWFLHFSLLLGETHFLDRGDTFVQLRSIAETRQAGIIVCKTRIEIGD